MERCPESKGSQDPENGKRIEGLRGEKLTILTLKDVEKRGQSPTSFGSLSSTL
jgi:hypothetical protein